MNGLEQDDGNMLADSARTYVARGYGEAMRAASMAHPQGCSPERWREFADMGWLALPLSEQDGGLGGSMTDICRLAEELGRALVVEPFVACAVLGPMLLAEVASASARSAWLPRIAAGATRVAFAPWEPGAGFNHEVIGMRACPGEHGYVLHGRKFLVPGGDGANAYLLAARLAAPDSLGIFLLPADAPGMVLTRVTLYDGQHATHLQLDQVSVTEALLTGPAADTLVHLRRTLDRATVAHCAETVGTMQRTFDLTLEYLKTRKQFSRTIAANQVVQHRMVDLFVKIEEARALALAAAAAPRRSAARPCNACPAPLHRRACVCDRGRAGRLAGMPAAARCHRHDAGIRAWPIFQAPGAGLYAVWRPGAAARTPGRHLAR